MDTRIEMIRGEIENLVATFMHYHRKDCKGLPLGSIQDAVKSGEITVDEMVSIFKSELETFLSQSDANSAPKSSINP